MMFGLTSLYFALALIPACVLTYGLSPSSSPKIAKRYDLVVIGGGSAGLTAAKFAATFGKSVAIIEKARMGGDCTWAGCIPSKSLLASSKAAHSIQKAKELGVVIDGKVSIDMKAVKNRIDANIQRIYKEDDSPEALEKLGVDVITGAAKFKDPKTLSVCITTSNSSSSSAYNGNTNGNTNDNKNDNEGGDGEFDVCANDGILIATGARPTPPQIKGIDQVDYITYEEAFSLDEVPKTMTVIGGGPIGCELAQAYSRLGAKVTVVASGLLPREEPETGEVMQRVFESEGIKVTNSRVQSVDGSGGNIHTVLCQDGEKISGDLLLVAIGRIPTVTGMDLEKLGVALNDNGGIKVDTKLQTSVKGLYAAGDCTGDRQFTHYAGYQGAVGARNILLPLTDPGVIDQVPATTFTDPEVASIGLTEKEAKAEFGDNKVAVAFQLINETDRGICEGNKEGFIKIVYKSRGYKILGATIASPVAGELIAEIAMAMKTGLSFDMLATVMHTYPSHSFALQSMAAEVYYDKLVKSKPLLNFLKWLGL